MILTESNLASSRSRRPPMTLTPSLLPHPRQTMTDQAMHDSEEEDSDYVLDEKDFEEDEEDDGDEPEETVGTGISAQKRSAVDAMWAEMNAASVAPPGRAGGGGGSSGKGNGKKGKKKAVKKANKVLAGIFGKTAASGIVSRAGKAKGSKRKQAGARDAAARVKALAASRSVEVTEVAKYAGKDIVLKKTVTAGSAEHAAAAAAKKKAGIDNMLAAIDGPKTISTVTKSSMDWETYKAAEGIEGEMQQATKDGKGYLNKQDFLQRCDVRKFEHELEARTSKRDA